MATKPANSKRKSAARPPSAIKLFNFDRALETRFVAGADEAGRGSLAGPLVAAAVVFDYENFGPREVRALAGLNDSKQQTVQDRERLYPLILNIATCVGVTSKGPRGIDQRGLHRTNLAALHDVLLRVVRPDLICLTDGFPVQPTGCPQKAVVGGDGKSAAIAAASIVAKVTRDRYMHRIARQYPHWSFEKHVGYSTPAHREAIAENGISPIHRMSFASVAYQQLQLDFGESAA